MKSVVVKKDFLLTKLQENRRKHEKEYRDAYRGWLQTTYEQADGWANQLEVELDGNEITPMQLERFDAPPANYLSEYDRAIEMAEASIDMTFELDTNEFDQYIRDEWGWKQVHLSNVTKYSGPF